MVISLPLRQTKLQRPRVMHSMVARPHLWAMLDRGIEKPLTLVCAGPGFGKTTLVSSWLEELAARQDPAPSLLAAWLSLDKHDSNLVVFLNYFIAALRTVAGNVCTETISLLQAPMRPQITLLVTTLVNELVRLPTRTILVLDDYSAISDEEVDAFLVELLADCPQTFHLVLITRHNPPLPLPSLRAKNEITEIRSHDLRFSHEETTAYLARALATPVDGSAVALLEQHAEGWIAGLQLMTLSLRAAGSLDAVMATQAINAANIAEYLADEALLRQPAAVQDFLLKTSILDHFCPSLCQAILGEPHPGWDASACIEWLVRTDLFIVPLDHQSEWYRYHHLFSDMLRERLIHNEPPEAFNKLHRRAALWFADQELFDDGLYHALHADDFELATDLIGRALPSVLNREDRHTLERWLSLLPEAEIQQRPELLMLRAWDLQFTWQLGTQARLLDQVEALMDAAPGDAEETRRMQALRAQIALLRGQEAYWHNQPELAIARLNQALPHFPETWLYLRGAVMLYLGVSMQAAGASADAQTLLLERFERYGDKRDMFALRIHLSLCFIYVADGQLERTRQTAQDMLRLAATRGPATLQSWGNYFLGIVHYQWNQLDIAERHFAKILDWRHAATGIVVREGLNSFAFILQRLGRGAHSLRVVDILGELDLDQLGREDDTTRALRAWHLLLQGDLDGAARWADAFLAPVPDTPLLWQADPQRTKVHILLARGRSDDLTAAHQIVDTLYAIATRTYNTRAQIEILSMRAVALHLQGRSAEADTALQRAIEMAQPGGFIRIFVDLGEPMRAMLLRLAAQGVPVHHLLAAFAEAAPHDEAVVSAIRADTPGSAGNGIEPAQPAVEALTAREREVLVLLSEPLSNKEIARRLDISYATVKRHSITIYGKLGVNSRWDAVAKARALGQLALR